jgi:hypothetical protein
LPGDSTAMKNLELSPRGLGSLGVCVAALVLSPLLSQRAHAFGGFWSAPHAGVKQAGEAIVFVDNPDSTITAIIQIQYAGPAPKFAWVIPVPGSPTVGVSSNTLFARLDAATAPEYWVEVAREESCSQPDAPPLTADAGSSTDAAPSGPGSTSAPIQVIDQGSVGPYDYVNIAVDPSLDDPAQAASDWFTLNGYDLTGIESSVLRPYLSDGLNLLAFKLSKDKAAGAIRPVVLTYPSERPMIPIRPTAVAAQDDMGIQVWVIGPSQAVPENYKSLVIDDALIDWWSVRSYVAGTPPAGGAGPFGPDIRKPRNYDALVSAAANEAGGQGFVTELAGPASQYRDKIWSALDAQEFTTISSQSYDEGLDAIVAASSHFGGWDGWNDAVRGASTLPADVAIEAFARDPEAYRGMAKVDAAQFFQLLDEHVVKPVADTAALFSNAPYLTRLYTTMSADEMTRDPVFDYNADLAQVSSVHIAKQFIQCGAASDQADWRVELPQGGVIVGAGTGDWPLAEGSLPANLKIVMLSSSGSGSVIEDNSAAIGSALFDAAGMTGSAAAVPQVPHNGVTIGGSQIVTAHAVDAGAPSTPKPGSPAARGSSCSVARVRTAEGSALALGWPLAGSLFALRRRRSRARRQL